MDLEDIGRISIQVNMLTTARYTRLLAQMPDTWMRAEVKSSITGHIRKPDSKNLTLLPRKALPGSRLPETNTCETNATNYLAFRSFFDSVDWSRRHKPRDPVSNTQTMGINGDWMS